MATHIFVFFPLCKLKILPTLRPCNFKFKSQSCLENNKCKDCDKPCLEIHWESCHCHMLPTVWCQKCCFMQIGKLGIAFWSNFSPLPLFHLSLLTIWFSCDKVQPRYTFEKCKYLDSPMFMRTTMGVNLIKCNKLFIVMQNCFRMAISLELIKINSYFFLFFFLVSIWPVWKSIN